MLREGMLLPTSLLRFRHPHFGLLHPIFSGLSYPDSPSSSLHRSICTHVCTMQSTSQRTHSLIFTP
ncbi:uncharacterized protein LACBIDRAFT_301558 [Laccaria bicolor S238N-H82]|uniref:Predicted protein n=1 Tax=Laccaria bicolor (strain S238N-H82 / ATCC MYA-4686) TaxID=486041 RepID=B0CNT8_LACBS|nr:uncharacterized protein LACBIDRAFT_301558 [Laccaria bicolor S238N-H82]EDR15997.1 predicted protein [Laccaria bicolor S238N-H82]|eukprot:XP_001874205.1 predicted protein [Laccaria bicolor S238N-H82]